MLASYHFVENAQSFCPITPPFGIYNCLLSFKRLPAEGKLLSLRVVVEDDEEEGSVAGASLV